MKQKTDAHNNMTVKSLLGALLAMVLALITAQGALAAPLESETMTIEIHKFEQPDERGVPSNGLVQDTTGLRPVKGATFTAKRVPGIDLTTIAGQQAASVLAANDAADLVSNVPAAASATTDASGNATLTPLDAGLYYVEEVMTPAGYVEAVPFLVALPLTDPVSRDQWLTTVHIYPKNAVASISLDVVDQDAIVLGDIVHWTSTSTIPNVPSLDGYRVEQVIDTKLEYTGTPVVSIAGGAPLTPGVDYTVTFDPDTNTVAIEFTDAGLRKLEDALERDPNSTVTIEYDTIVLREGELINEAILYPSRSSIDDGRGVSDTAITKWGPLSVVVHEYGNPSNLIANACFMVYASEADARAQRNPISVDGVNQWVTDDQGRFIVPGLRFSNFANGLDRDPSDPLYRLYWAVPVCIPPGWTWVDDRPLAGAVNDVLQFQTLIFEVERKPVPPSIPDMPVTGSQVAGLGFLGISFILAGIIALASRRRQARDTGVSASL